MAAPEHRVMHRNSYPFKEKEGIDTSYGIEVGTAANNTVKLFVSERSRLTIAVVTFARLVLAVVLFAIGWKVRSTEIGLAITCLSLTISHILSILCLHFALSFKIVKISHLCRALGTPWMLIALETTSLQCGVLSEAKAGFLTLITLAITVLYTFRELLGLFFVLRSKLEEPDRLGACLAAESIIFGGPSNVTKPNAESFGAVLLFSLALGFAHWRESQDWVLLLTTLVVIVFNIASAAKPLSKLRTIKGMREIIRDLAKLIWILALRQTHDECVNSR